MPPPGYSCYYSRVIAGFADQGTEDIFNGVNSAAARRICPRQLHSLAVRKMTALNRADRLEDLGQLPGNRLEALHGDRRGQHSIRINSQYRICFFWEQGRASAVAITDYHG